MKSQGLSRVEPEQERGVGLASQNTYDNIIREIVKYCPETWTSARCGVWKTCRLSDLFMKGKIATSDDVTDVMRS